jgi:hypothetical protein
LHVSIRGGAEQIVIALCLPAGGPPAQVQSEVNVLYQDLTPDQFMRQWLVCGPFPARAENLLAAILRVPSQRFTVIHLSNDGTLNTGRISHQIAEIYLWQQMPPQTVAR